MQNLSYENEFDLHENDPVSGTHWFHTETRFDTEAKATFHYDVLEDYKVSVLKDDLCKVFCLHYSTGTHNTTMFIYGRVGQPSHRAVYLTYMQKCRSTKAGHENPQKPAGGKNTGNVYPRPRQWCNPWGFRVC